MDPIAQLTTALAGRYEIEREIGAGGMATVYLARDLKHDRRVALKVLKPELGAVLGVERFLAEIKVTANLQHPNLLPLFDSGAADGLLFYVMPYVEGESLRARLDREKQLPVDDAVRIAVAVAGALDYAHRQGVIHRDLKPENILLHEGQPLVADFGIALAVSNAGGARITQTGLSLGTPQYMSPEQATGDRVVDGRSDIYSLAAVTYEMLAGEAPHTGTTAQAIIARVLTEHPRSVRLSRPSVPEHVEAALERALEKLAADRWATAGEFAAALQGRAVGALTSTHASTAGAHRALAGWRAHVRSPVVLLLAAVAVAAVVVAAGDWSAAHRPDDSTIVRFQLALPQNVSVPNALTGTTVTISRDGRTVAFVASGSSGVVQQLFVRTLDDVLPHVLPGTEGASTPFFSPDGKWLAFWSGGKLQKVALDGGMAQSLIDVPHAFGATWSEGGPIVVSAESALVVVPASGAAPRPLTNRDTARHELSQRWPVALADGETVLYASWGDGGRTRARIGVASLSSGAVTLLDVTGTCPLGVIDGFLVYATATNTLQAVPFDVRGRRVLGAPITLGIVVAEGADGGASAGLSLTGSLAFQAGSQGAQVVLADAHGGTAALLQDVRTYGYPRFSPDGKRVAVTIWSGSRNDIWIHDVASRTTTRLTTRGNINERPEWTPDGTRVLFRSDIDGRSGLWWQPADLSGPAVPLLVNKRADYYEGVFTPDGRGFIYQVDTSVADLFYRSVAGDTTPRPVAATPAVEMMPRLSPDGRWLAFVTNESSANQVVVQPFPGPGAHVQVSTGGGTEPVWSRDGRRLFYRDGRQFIAATVVTSPSFAVTSRVPLFDDGFLPAVSPHANYDVAPDGAHWLLLKATQNSQVIVVHHWVADLRARIAAQARK